MTVNPQNIVQKPRSRRLLGMIALLAAGFSLAGCSSFEKPEIACPKIKAVAGAESFNRQGTWLGQPVSVRFNLVTARCTEAGAEQVRMRVDAGLMIRRGDNDVSKTEEVPVDITLAMLDAQGAVLERQRFSDLFYIPMLETKSRPVMSFTVILPETATVLVGFGKLAGTTD